MHSQQEEVIGSVKLLIQYAVTRCLSTDIIVSVSLDPNVRLKVRESLIINRNKNRRQDEVFPRPRSVLH